MREIQRFAQPGQSATDSSAGMNSSCPDLNSETRSRGLYVLLKMAQECNVHVFCVQWPHSMWVPVMRFRLSPPDSRDWRAVIGLNYEACTSYSSLIGCSRKSQAVTRAVAQSILDGPATTKQLALSGMVFSSPASGVRNSEIPIFFVRRRALSL